MAVTISEFTSFLSSNNSSKYTCMANVTPPTNQLLLAWCHIGGSSIRQVTNFSGCGLTWNSVTSQKYAASNTSLHELSLWSARGTPSTGTIGIVASGSCDNCSITILQCTGESGTLVQSATTRVTAASALTAILSAFSSANNATAVGWSRISGNENLNPTAPTLKLSQVAGSATGADAYVLASAWSSANVLNSVVTWTTSGISGNACGIACEINVAAAGGALDSPYYSAYYSHIVTGVS